MDALYPWSSLQAVERALEGASEAQVREWLPTWWNAEYLQADEAVVKRLMPYIDLARVRDRAATVLFAVDHDWADVLERSDDAACGFTPAFWRDAFARAKAAGSAQCTAWLLDRKGDMLVSADSRGLEL